MVIKASFGEKSAMTFGIPTPSAGVPFPHTKLVHQIILTFRVKLARKLKTIRVHQIYVGWCDS